MGLLDGTLPDSAFSASSSMFGSPPQLARIGNTGWCADPGADMEKNFRDEYLQVDFGKVIYFGPWVYPKASLVIGSVVRLCVRPFVRLQISQRPIICFFYFFA